MRRLKNHANIEREGTAPGRKNSNHHDGSLMIFLMILPHMILPIPPSFTGSK